MFQQLVAQLLVSVRLDLLALLLPLLINLVLFEWMFDILLVCLISGLTDCVFDGCNLLVDFPIKPCLVVIGLVILKIGIHLQSFPLDNKSLWCIGGVKIKLEELFLKSLWLRKSVALHLLFVGGQLILELFLQLFVRIGEPFALLF